MGHAQGFVAGSSASLSVVGCVDHSMTNSSQPHSRDACLSVVHDGQMPTQLTPGRLALYGVAGFIGGMVVMLIMAIIGTEVGAVRLLAQAMWVVGGLLLLAAFIAKAVQVGVRSSQD